VSCAQCGDLGRLTVGHAVEAVRWHRVLLGHDCESGARTRELRSACGHPPGITTRTPPGYAMKWATGGSGSELGDQ
jgi:hypothetical protein